MTSFPQSNGVYYGVDYGDRERNGVPDEEGPKSFVPDGSYPANDLSWYANIPVPTSYMVTGTEEDFFGGYDHAAQAGVVHVANHHVAPGKKQWTWGNHEFGYAWDRNLTDNDGPYIELMAGVYTDNQPDFSFLSPWETKTFVQTWFPIRAIGAPQASNTEAALSLRSVNSQAQVGLYVTRDIGNVQIVVQAGAKKLWNTEACVDVANPLLLYLDIPAESVGLPLSARIFYRGGLLIEYDESNVVPAKAPTVAIEPPPPSDIESVEDLYLTGLHLHQYRHATRLPETYWREALKRDPNDSRSNNALGLWHLRRGEFSHAKEHFSRAIARLTRLNPNPYDGEPYYNLGLTERFLGNDKLAYDALYKATWNAAWRAPAYLALAEIDATRGEWQKARDHLQRSLTADTENLAARNLLVITLNRLDRPNEAKEQHQRIRELDPLDLTSRYRDGILPANGQETLDLAFDLIRAGQADEAAMVLRTLPESTRDGTLPIALLLLAQVESELHLASASATLNAANHSPLDYCFPSRIEEFIVLQRATDAAPDQAAPYYLLGNWLYDRRRYEDAIQAWEAALRLDPSNAITWRNLGIAMFNVRGNAQRAKEAFDHALEANPEDGRLWYERDQLWKRIGVDPVRRLAELQKHLEIAYQRDDLSVELAMLYNQVGQPVDALQLLGTRQFQPWEGGEGLVLGQFVRAHLLSGRRSLDSGLPDEALAHFEATLTPPLNLSEARHLLANQSDIFYWLGQAHEALGHHADAVAIWQRATRQRGDFQQMAVRAISDMTYWTGMAHLALGNTPEASRIFQEIYDYSLELERTEPKIDYFATSLPAMLLFVEDLVRRNQTDAKFLRAQALAGLGRVAESANFLQDVLLLDSNHAGAADLLDQLSVAHAETR
jgi:tetratricopeptide (TPR) repeat protein